MPIPIEQAVKLSTLRCASGTQFGSSHFGTVAPAWLPLYLVPPGRHSRLAGRQPWKTASGSTATMPSAPLPKRKAVSVENPPQVSALPPTWFIGFRRARLWTLSASRPRSTDLFPPSALAVVRAFLALLLLFRDAPADCPVHLNSAEVDASHSLWARVDNYLFYLFDKSFYTLIHHLY